ncbi:MAG: hypothetical protein AAB368_09605 [bacterium]
MTQRLATPPTAASPSLRPHDLYHVETRGQRFRTQLYAARQAERLRRRFLVRELRQVFLREYFHFG